MKTVNTDSLCVGYLEAGTAEAVPVILLHGFPYDVHAYDAVTPRLVDAGCRVITPYLRGYGATRFLDGHTLRSGQQAVLAHDLLAFMNALKIERAILAGYDWGGRAACIVAALWPERVIGLISGNGYNIQNIPAAGDPESPSTEHRYWYQYYFHGERGRAGLARNRYAFCKLLWRLWSPNWRFDDDTYAQTARSFDNPDFVDVVIHSYRHRFGLVPGDPEVEAIEQRLTEQPRIEVPAIALAGEADGVIPPEASESHDRFFGAAYEHRGLPIVGHNLPQEAPREFADAVMDLI